MKISIRSLFGLAVAVIMVTVFSVNGMAQNATEEMFVDSIEYHFLLNDTVNVSESYMPSLPAQLVEQLAPMFLLKTEGEHGTGMYVDTPDRVLRQQNLILRVKQGKITLKARGETPESVLDLEKCDKKKYEIDDFLGSADYSISSDIKFEDIEFDIDFMTITPQKLYAFIQERCPAMYDYLKPFVDDPRVRIPGVASQYEFEISLPEDHPLAEKIEVGLTIWFMSPRDDSIVELAYTGDIADKEALDALQAETVEFLTSRGLLRSDQGSKTQFYFDTFLEGEK